MNLDSIQNVKGDDDRVLAAQAVFEGQATLVPLQAMMGPGMDMPAGFDRIREMIREQQSSMPVFARTPEFLQEQLIFPYINGMDFMRRFNRERPGQMPYGKDLPASSAQIVHPTEYFGSPREMPITITFPAPRTGSLAYDNVMGEFSTKVMIYQVLRDQNQATQAAAGWTGDRYVLVHTPQGDAFAWLMLLETPGRCGIRDRDAANRRHALQRDRHEDPDRHDVLDRRPLGDGLGRTGRGPPGGAVCRCAGWREHELVRSGEGEAELRLQGRAYAYRLDLQLQQLRDVVDHEPRQPAHQGAVDPDELQILPDREFDPLRRGVGVPAGYGLRDEG
jgi:hypothetical protein